jgi:hypothetical protein
VCFDTLLFTGCLLPGKTCFSEQGKSVSVIPQSGETVLFFSIDNPNCELRQLIGLDRAGEAICDLLVFYAIGDKRTICFVELKGKDLEKAVEQVVNTHNKLKSKLKQKFASKAFIVFGGSVPQDDRYKKQLEVTFGKNNCLCSRSGDDLRNLLRGEALPLKGKQKRKKR